MGATTSRHPRQRVDARLASGSFDPLQGLERHRRDAGPPLQVCTWLGPPERPPETLCTHQLQHHVNVFFEDCVHDWDWRDGRFRYHSRLVPSINVESEPWLQPGIWILIRTT